MTWTSSLATRLAILWSLTLGLAVALASWIAHRDAEKHLLETLQQSVQQDAKGLRVKTQTWVKSLREDASFCSQSPLLREFFGHRGTDEEPYWRGLLEDEFRAVFAGKPAYYQIRVLGIGGADDGREVVRLDRRDGKLEVTPLDKLQSKGERTYFQEAKGLPTGQVYFSEINLNQDFGVVTTPHIPTLRSAAQVDIAGQSKALLIINANLGGLFDEIVALSSPRAEVRLATSRGDYLMHPKPEAIFGFDLGTSWNVVEEFGRAALSDVDGMWLRQAKDKELVWAAAFPLAGWPNRSLSAIVSLPGDAWLPQLAESRARSIWGTGLAALLGAGVAWLIALPFVKRLSQLSSALRSFDVSDPVESLIDSRHEDEIGVAIRRFQEMADKVRVQVERLHEARNQAQAADAAKEEFLAVMSHEIRTPMNAIVGLIRALDANNPPVHQRPIITTLKSSADSLLALLNTALDYTRLKEGALRFLEEDYDVAAVVRETARAHAPSAMTKGLDLKVDASESPWMVRGDPVRARQVLNNLLHNAIKFTEKGSVSVELKQRDGFMIFQVADSGPGITEQDRKQIFQPFGQTDLGRRSKEVGAGLGLSVTTALLEQQGGRLELQSTPGEGSIFTVWIPYKSPKTEALAASPLRTSHSDHSLFGRRMLYVEDVGSNQQVMELTLDGTGVELVCVGTGSEALELVERVPFDLVLVDLQLPDMSGDTLGKSLLINHSDMPIIAVTAQASDRVRERCLSAGLRALVLKPYSKEALLDEIRRCLDPGMGASVNRDVLTALHPTDSERRRRLAHSIAEELNEAADTIARFSIEMNDDSQRELRRLRHQLTTAIAELRLQTVDQALCDLSSTSTPTEAIITGAVDALRQAAHDLMMR